MQVNVYSKDNCSYCTKAVALLEQNGIGYMKHMLDKDFTREELKASYPTARSFPVIDIDGKYIGGHAELKKMLETPNYTC